MSDRIKKFIWVPYLLLLLTIFAYYKIQDDIIPITGYTGVLKSDQESAALPSLEKFVSSIEEGNSSSLAGVYADGLFALEIVEQPSGRDAFVAARPGVVTLFSEAEDFGSVGLLAHNYLAGSYFFDLEMHEQISLISGDGILTSYRVIAFRRFEALDSRNPKSNFHDLTKGQNITAEKVFRQVYAHKNRLIFQTCIQENGNDEWGRLFVIAEPVEAETNAGNSD